MLVDRIFNSRFDNLESKRENGYRHPHCIIVTLAIGKNKNLESIGEEQRVLEEHPCIDLELIEEVDSDSWLLCYSLCVCVKCSSYKYLLLVMHLLSCYVYEFMC